MGIVTKTVALLAGGLVLGVVMAPIASVLIISIATNQQGVNVGTSGLHNFFYVIEKTKVVQWLANSLVSSVVTVIVTLAISAPAGYVLSRSRQSSIVRHFGTGLFVIKSLPALVVIIPMFVLFARMGLVDTLTSAVVIYVSGSIAVTVWMFAAYYDNIPVAIEEASFIDGCSVIESFVYITLRNSTPVLMSAGIFTFLLAWNDYLIAVTFLKSSENFTLPLGIQTFFQINQAEWGAVMAVSVVMMLPPVVLFTLFGRFFSLGSMSGAVAGR